MPGEGTAGVRREGREFATGRVLFLQESGGGGIAMLGQAMRCPQRKKEIRFAGKKTLSGLVVC